MNKSYLLTLQPMEPYFFGNEKTFSFNPQKPEDNRYFIKSERMPLQTTVLGAMRYLLMPVKNANYQYTPEEQNRNGAIVGEESFRMGSQKQSFGAIVQISPLFLVKDEKKYVRTPFDHQSQVVDRYSPMETCPVGNDKRLYFPAYNAKEGIADSYMNVDDGALVSSEEIFRSTVRVGVSKEKHDKALFKKQYMRLSENWSFGCYITLDVNAIAADGAAQAALMELEAGTVAYLGQNKSAFVLRLQAEENDLKDKLQKLLRPEAVYCLGDALVDGGIYDNCLLAVTMTRDYRAFRTVFKTSRESGRVTGGISKNPELYKLLAAGSVLFPDPEKKLDDYFRNPNCRVIGYNITIPEWEDEAE